MSHDFTQFLRRRIWLGLILALLLMGTAFQVAFAAERSLQPAPPISVRFPRVVLTLDEGGAVTSLGVVISEGTQLRFAEPQLAFLSSILGLNLRTQMFDAATMAALADADIQHVEIQTGSEGVALYGNGLFLMGVKWGDQAVLAELMRLAEAANIHLALPVAEIVPAIGADVLVELPTPAGAEPIAPRALGSGIEFPGRAVAPGEAQFILHATGQYAADGTAVMLGTPLSEWGSLLGADLRTLNLDPRAMPVFQEAGVQNMGVRMDSEGTSLLINGDPVATVVLGDQESLELAERLADRFQVPFAEFIPLAGKTRDLDIQVSVELPPAR